MELKNNEFATVNPATGEILKIYKYQNLETAQATLEQCQQGFLRWKTLSFQERGEVLCKVAGNLRKYKHELAELIRLEMGKSLAEAQAEIEKSAKTCEFYANQAESFLQAEVIKNSPYASAEIYFCPQGVIFSIMPWNFPVWQVLRFTAPALMVGNTVLLKHAELTTGTGLFISEIFKMSFSEYPLLLPLIVNHQVAAELMSDARVRGVTFTGSSRGGREVAAQAGRSLKKTVLELGGSDAYVVLPDADLELAARVSSQGRLQNCGQSCVAAKRFIVHESLYEDFLQKLKLNMESSGPLNPLAAKKFQTQLDQQVQSLIAMGAQCVLGGVLPTGQGAYYPATILSFEENVMRSEIHQEELFGPVALVYKYKTVEEAFALANLAPYGLGGGIFSRDTERARKLAALYMDTGFVAINDIVKSDPSTPFGGVKDSGYGRELSRYGLLEFVNIKTVGIARA